MDFAVELGVATLMVLATVAIQGVGLMALGTLLDRLARATGRLRANPVSWEGAAAAGITALGLLVVHGAQIWLYGGFYHLTGAVPGLRDAVFFSTISFASIGYGDVTIAPGWKLLGAIEGINGALLLGWSVAFFVAELTRHDRRARLRAER